MNIAILIPAYQPDQKLISVVESLLMQCVYPILVVNDGSDETCHPIFDMLSTLDRVTVLNHDINRGKGRALKTGMQYCLSHPDIDGCITVDADGQHTPHDILRIIDVLQTKSDYLILGSRDFDLGHVPLKSMLGNKITRFITSLLIGQKLTDTQTGLRAFSTKSMEKFIDVPGERYEYEMNMLLYCKRYKITIQEVTIETVYLDNNASSHFDPLSDSIRIYKQIFAFAFSSIASALLDWSLFTIGLYFFSKLSEPILVATVVARLISMNFNFAMNKKLVFRSKSGWRSQVVKYYLLAGFQMLASAYLVKFFALTFTFNAPAVKIGVDLMLFLLSYQIQRRLIFKQED